MEELLKDAEFELKRRELSAKEYPYGSLGLISIESAIEVLSKLHEAWKLHCKQEFEKNNLHY